MKKEMVKLGARVSTRVGCPPDMPVYFGHQAFGTVVDRYWDYGDLVMRYDVDCGQGWGIVCGARYAFPTAVNPDTQREFVEIPDRYPGEDGPERARKG